MKSPCMNCKCRSIGCHSKCPGYAAYKNKLEELKKTNKQYEEQRYAKWR